MGPSVGRSVVRQGRCESGVCGKLLEASRGLRCVSPRVTRGPCTHHGMTFAGGPVGMVRVRWVWRMGPLRGVRVLLRGGQGSAGA